MQNILHLFNSIYSLSEGLETALKKIIKRKEVRKKDYILKQGHICNDIFFIEKGIFRCFYVEQEKDICAWFMKENDVIVSVESFFTRKPSYENIQAIEDSIVYYISFNELNWLYKTFLEFNIIGRILTERYYTLSEQRSYLLRSKKAIDRYQHLITYFPEIVIRVPSGYIASYLGITIETLSRIKRRK